MSIGVAEIFLFLIFLVLSYIAYTLIKQLRTLETYQARRIQGIMVVGAVLYWLNIFTPRELGGQSVAFTAAGILIFLYGYGLLLLEKFRQGRREAHS